jgi:hypothetical protein
LTKKATIHLTYIVHSIELKKEGKRYMENYGKGDEFL